MSVAVAPPRLLADALRAALGEKLIKDRPLDLARMSHDASHYLLRPQAVVMAAGADDVSRAVRVATEYGVPVTFRSGGTSLSGQASTDGVLIDTRRGFRGIEVLDEHFAGGEHLLYARDGRFWSYTGTHWQPLGCGPGAPT